MSVETIKTTARIPNIDWELAKALTGKKTMTEVVQECIRLATEHNGTTKVTARIPIKEWEKAKTMTGKETQTEILRDIVRRAVGLSIWAT